MKNKTNKKRLMDMSLQMKMSLCILLAVLIPISIISVVFIGKLYDLIIADSIGKGQQISFQVVPEIEAQVDELTAESLQIQNEPLYATLFNRPMDGDWEELLASDQRKHMESYLDTLIGNTPFQAVRFYMDRNDRDFEEAEGKPDFMESDYAVHSVYWHGIFSGSNVHRIYCSPDYLSRREREELGDSAIIYKKTYYYHGQLYVAYLAFYYSSDLYKEILRPEERITGTVSYILDERDTIISGNAPETQGLYRMRYATVEDLLLSSNSFREMEINGETVYIDVNRIKKENWYLVNVIPRKPLIAMSNRVMFDFAGCVIICILVALGITIGQAQFMIRRIRNMAMQMKKVHEGPPEAMAEPEIFDEVGELVDSYNYMVKQMNELIEKQQETAEELRIAEFNSLQAQINPHFLFNTMDMINWMAVQGKNEEVSETVQSLARFYKLTLSRKKKFSTIQDELEHARTYMNLQNRRFKNAIDFVEDIPDELSDYRIPKLTFQPILENSILHGILEKEDKSGTILITAWTEEEDILILISDDGVGMEEEVRSHLLDSESREHFTKGTNIAVVNIHNRLRILYGEKYGLSYASVPGEGCEVTIRIPKHLGDTPFIPQKNTEIMI